MWVLGPEGGRPKKVGWGLHQTRPCKDGTHFRTCMTDRTKHFRLRNLDKWTGMQDQQAAAGQSGIL